MADKANGYLFATPMGVEPLFGNEGVVRRVIMASGFDEASRVLVLRGSQMALSLASLIGCEVVFAHENAEARKNFQRAADTAQVAAWCNCVELNFEKPSFREKEFHGILALGFANCAVPELLGQYRNWLKPEGRVAISYPVAVGRTPNEAATSFWQENLGHPLMKMNQLFEQFEKHGFEPELSQSANVQELASYYELIKRLGQGNDTLLNDECDLFERVKEKNGYSIALILARRKETGERPKPTRSRG